MLVVVTPTLVDGPVAHAPRDVAPVSVAATEQHVEELEFLAGTPAGVLNEGELVADD